MQSNDLIKVYVYAREVVCKDGKKFWKFVYKNNDKYETIVQSKKSIENDGCFMDKGKNWLVYVPVNGLFKTTDKNGYNVTYITKIERIEELKPLRK